MPHLVSIISEQTLPNVLFIKEWADRVDSYLFITTEKMEKQGQLGWVLAATGLRAGQYRKVVVVEDDLKGIKSALDTLSLAPQEPVIVHLTGGTKIMSIGVYNYFSHRNSQIFYIPIGKNVYHQLLPTEGNQRFELGTRIDLLTYLKSYGIEMTEPHAINQLTKQEEFTKEFFTKSYSMSQHLTHLFNLRRASQRDIFYPEDLPQLFDWLQTIGFPFEQAGRLNGLETKYLLGGWLEEYVYTFIKTELDLPDSAIGCSVRIKRRDVSNEFDVMFVKDNAIHVLECKTGLKSKDLYEQAVYKLAALKKDFGLFTSSYIATMTPVKNEVWRNRAALFSIQLLDDLKNQPERLRQAFDKQRK